MSLKLRVQNFRSHVDYTVDISDGISIITGPNGSGKTSLIEAIYICYAGKSWRSNFDEINHVDGSSRSDWWRIDLTDGITGESRVVKYQCGQKEFIINGRSFKRLPQSARRPVILFEPNDMQLLYGSPSRRRQFIDKFIAQLEPEHQTELNKFERVLKQRNNLLKQDEYSADEMMVWNIQFASLSNSISTRRRQYLKIIDNMLSTKYTEIADSDTSIKIRFLAGAPNSSAEIINRLQTSPERVTPIGSQKDDYRFDFKHSDAKTTASRGENRTIIFAMLGVMADLARKQSANNKVTILLDDIDSELDKAHRLNLYAMSSFQRNTIATTLEYSAKDVQNIALEY